jgi:hypothetical protein
MHRFALLAFLFGCNEYKLNPNVDPNEEPDSDADTDPGLDTGVPAEECNGEDDDQDGEIDEGFLDVDADGIADCLDDACDVEMPAPRSEVDSTCEGGVEGSDPPVDPWDVGVEWSWTGTGVVSTPVVGDLDLDGIPEVVASDYAGTYVLDGTSGTVLWSIPGTDGYSGVALGDVDGDGFGDIITTRGSYGTPHSIEAWDSTGTRLWATMGGKGEETYPLIADLDADGDVEVVVNEYVFDGATGAVLFTLAISGGQWGAPAAADMDGDGVMEILLENRIYDLTGKALMTCGVGGIGSFPHPVNVDADLEGEFLVAGYGQMTLCDDDGTQLWSRTYPSYGTAMACADFDGDGLMEFAFPTGNVLYLIDDDGSNLWTTPIADASGLAGTTSWDVNYDGAPEIVYADEQDILVIDGATGTIVARDPNHASWTAAETPAVADVDGDGAGELVYGSNGGGYNGVTVIGGTDGDWPYSKPVYNQYTYYGDNVEDDLSIPPTPEAPWIADANIFRGQPSAIYLEGTPNLRVAITDVCVASCDEGGYAAVWVQVWNDGAIAIDAGMAVHLYGTVGGSQQLIASSATTASIPSGGSEEMLFETTSEKLGTELYVVVDEPDLLAECDEDDNVGVWTDLPSCD